MSFLRQIVRDAQAGPAATPQRRSSAPRPKSGEGSEGMTSLPMVGGLPAVDSLGDAIESRVAAQGGPDPMPDLTTLSSPARAFGLTAEAPSVSGAASAEVAGQGVHTAGQVAAVDLGVKRAAGAKVVTRDDGPAGAVVEGEARTVAAKPRQAVTEADAAASSNLLTSNQSAGSEHLPTVVPALVDQQEVSPPAFTRSDSNSAVAQTRPEDQQSLEDPQPADPVVLSLSAASLSAASTSVTSVPAGSVPGESVPAASVVVMPGSTEPAVNPRDETRLDHPPVSPSVHIGHLEVIVVAPEGANGRPAQPISPPAPAASSGGRRLASRRFLRAL